MAIKARDERAGELDKLERECRYRLGQANLKYNEALVSLYSDKYSMGSKGSRMALEGLPQEGPMR